MLASRGVRVPVGDEWVHEVKWDGVRTLVDVRDGEVRLWSRRENQVSVTYPELRGLSRVLPHDCLVDGEVVAFENGIPSFAAIADRMNITTAARAVTASWKQPVTLLAFDLLRLEGHDLISEPLVGRRELLESLDLQGSRWQTPPQYDDGVGLHEATKAQGLEGVVSKRRTSRYEFGVRSPHWLKFPHRHQASYVVGGWRTETDAASRLGSVLVGAYTADGGLAYRGKVGSGLAGRAGEMLKQVLTTIPVAASPFVDVVPREDSMGTFWVEPLLVIDVAALGLSRELRLRAPAYQRVRPDLDALDVLVDAAEDGS